jgi:hypothetical protein
MSQKPFTAPPPPRPYLLDYFLLLVGFSVSLYLMELSPLTVEPRDEVTHHVARAWVVFLPLLLRVPEGIILFLPVFFLLQFVMLRKHEITSGEWLWIIDWMGTTALTGVAAYRHEFGLPEQLETYWPTARWVWYLGFGAAMAALAALATLYNLIRRAPMPWTHGLGLALVLWPVVPLVGILLLTK